MFYRNEQGEVLHADSCYARGLDMSNGACHYMHLVPKGRDEDGLPYTMAWLHRRDQYEDEEGLSIILTLAKPRGRKDNGYDVLDAIVYTDG